MAAALRWIMFALLLAFALAFPTENKSRAVSDRCKSAGLFCLDCQTLAVCIDIGGEFLEFEQTTCPNANSPCSQSLKDCSEKESFCKLGTSFLCQSEGRFPDPYDCNVYHECGPAVGEDSAPLATHVCPPGTAYSPRSGACDLSDAHPTCDSSGYPLPLCKDSGVAVGAVDLNPEYYWVCAKEVIRVFKCASGQVFDEPSYRCVAAETPGTEAPDTEAPDTEAPDTEAPDTEAPDTEAPDTDAPATEAPSTPPAIFQCVDSSRQPDPADCHRYYDCSDVQRPLLAACPFPKYFHQRKKRCVIGFCSS